MKRPLIGSQVIRSNDSLQRIAVVINVTDEENVLRYEDGTEVWDKDLPFTYVGFSDPANWAPAVSFPREANKEELERMARSIKNRGLIEPISIHNDVMLDGRNRLMACNLAGVDPHFTEIHTEDPIGWAEAKNLDRRHLSTADIKQMIFGMKEYVAKIAANKKKNSLGGVKLANSTNETLVSNDTEVGRTRKIIAEQFGVSEATVGRAFAEQKVAIELKEKAPELAEKVKAGELTLKQARIQAGLLVQPRAENEPIEFEVTISFPKRHLNTFKIFAKENDIVWTSN